MVVCGGLPAFHRFHRLSSQILVVVCGSLRWFVVVCGGLPYSHAPDEVTAIVIPVIPVQRQDLSCRWP